MKILMTGLTGFTGTHLAERVLEDTDWDIVSVERLTPRVNPLVSPRIQRFHHDFRAPLPTRLLKACEGVDHIIHLGAEVQGLRSLENPELFVHSNVMGTYQLLEAARILKPKKFIYMSSAETVGSAGPQNSLAENATLRPSNPYSAAKAAGEMLTRSYALSFGVPALTVRTMNIFGERQDTSKFVPGVIKKIVNDEIIKCHVGPTGTPGSRHWIYVGVLVTGLLNLLSNGRAGEVYHITGPELNNLHVIHQIEAAMGQIARLEFVQPGPSHDMRYSITDTKLDHHTYSATYTKEALRTTVQWYQENPQWLES